MKHSILRLQTFLILIMTNAGIAGISSSSIITDAHYSSIAAISGVHGTINTLLFTKHGLFAGGSFTFAGNVEANCVAKWDGTRWSSLGTRFSKYGNVYALCEDSSGNLYIGGSFDSLNNVPVKNIAMWDGNTWSPVDKNMSIYPESGTVRALAIDKNNNLYAGGDFDSIDGINTGSVAKWDGHQWHPLGSGVKKVSGIALDKKGCVYVSTGSFGYLTKSYVYKWDGLSWYPLDSLQLLDVYTSGSQYYYTSAITIDNAEMLYVCGQHKKFNNYDNFVKRYDGQNWETIGTATKVSTMSSDNQGAYIKSIVCDENNDLFAAGDFTSIGGDLGSTANYNSPIVVKYEDKKWTAQFQVSEGSVYALAPDANGGIYAGGSFKFVNDSVEVKSITKYDGKVITVLGGEGQNREVYAIALNSSGEVFTETILLRNTLPYGFLQIKKYNGAQWSGAVSSPGLTAYTSDARNMVFDMDDHLYVTGSGDNVVRMWNTISWDTLKPGTKGFNGKVLAYDKNKNLYVGGYFDSTSCLKRWDGISWSNVDAFRKYGEIQSLALDSSGNLYAGGHFYTTDYSGHQIARWDGEFWTGLKGSQSFYTDNNYAFVNVLICDRSGNLYANARISADSDQKPYNYIGIWDGVNWDSLGSTIRGEIYVFACDRDGRLFIGGQFSEIDNEEICNVAMWDDGKWNALGSGTDGTVYALAVRDSVLYAGGTFSHAGGKGSPYISKISIFGSVPQKIKKSGNAFVNKIQCRIYRSILIITNALPNDCISVYSLSGQLLYQIIGNTKINLSRFSSQQLIISISRGGMPVLTKRVFVVNL